MNELIRVKTRPLKQGIPNLTTLYFLALKYASHLVISFHTYET